MAVRRGLDNYQAAGFGGLSFATNLNFMNLPMSYEQRLWALEGLYACAIAKNEEDKKYSENVEVSDLIQECRKLLDQAGTDYSSKYETHATYSTEENNYRKLISLIFEKITQLQGKTKMIERVREEQMEA